MRKKKVIFCLCYPYKSARLHPFSLEIFNPSAGRLARLQERRQEASALRIGSAHGLVAPVKFLATWKKSCTVAIGVREPTVRAPASLCFGSAPLISRIVSHHVELAQSALILEDW